MTRERGDPRRDPAGGVVRSGDLHGQCLVVAHPGTSGKESAAGKWCLCPAVAGLVAAGLSAGLLTPSGNTVIRDE